MKSLMKTRKQKETNEKEIHLLEQKGYERMMNEIMPVQQAEVYRKPTKKVVEEAVKELNPDTNIHPPANIGKYKCLIRLFFLWILNKLSIFSYINPELF